MKQTMSAVYNDSKINFNHFRFTDLEVTGIAPNTHNAFEIIFLKEGNLDYVVDEKIYNVKSGSLILTRPNKIHSLHFKARTYDRCDIVFNPDIIFPEVYNSLPKELDVITLENPSVFMAMYSKLDYFCNYFSGEALKNIISNITEEIFYYITVAANTQSDEISLNEYTTDPVLTKAIDYIKQNITTPINLTQMCNELYISKSYLHKIFLNRLQTTPKKYITSKRLALIQKALCANAKPTETYSEYGFTDYSSFYRSYTKHFGYPPSQKPDTDIRNISIDF